MSFRLVAIIRDVCSDDIISVMNALLDNGISEVEISLSNEELAMKSIAVALKEYKGKARIGAGTVTKVSQVYALKELGIDFIITPAYDDEIVSACIENELEIIPGVFTPGDVMRACNRGIPLLKLFPCDALPLNYIKSLKGPFPNAQFLAVGGVKLDTIDAIKKAGFLGIAPGNDLVKRGSTSKDVETIAEKARMYVEACK